MSPLSSIQLKIHRATITSPPNPFSSLSSSRANPPLCVPMALSTVFSNHPHRLHSALPSPSNTMTWMPPTSAPPTACHMSSPSHLLLPFPGNSHLSSLIQPIWASPSHFHSAQHFMSPTQAWNPPPTPFSTGSIQIGPCQPSHTLGSPICHPVGSWPSTCLQVYPCASNCLASAKAKRIRMH
ncbi:hypothetical protein BCR44DRAFT_34112 [Catenaria anguillulae PL171]|uniref:Uncharacterized protein n=1 Tax=Catenaria anguillulae PL171 TaxID=765915 RepID=A0A1Y2HWH5_9FUNG|nr:hypothetical protein BCR44DRAFT_34112 [Catenaria anguillulae PL171]